MHIHHLLMHSSGGREEFLSIIPAIIIQSFRSFPPGLVFTYSAAFLPDPVIVTDTQSLLLREMEKEASRKRRVSPLTSPILGGGGGGVGGVGQVIHAQQANSNSWRGRGSLIGQCLAAYSVLSTSDLSKARSCAHRTARWWQRPESSQNRIR